MKYYNLQSQSIYKNHLCLYTLITIRKKIKKIPLIIASKRIKHLATNLTKDIKPVVGKLESTDKETDENTNKQKHIPCSSTGTMSN